MICSSNACSRSRASASVEPRIGTMPGRITICSGRRPACDGAALHVGVERLAVLERALRGEHRLGVARGEAAARLGLAGLDQQRVALRRARGVERPATR